MARKNNKHDEKAKKSGGAKGEKRVPKKEVLCFRIYALRD